MTNETLNFETPDSPRFPLQGIPLSEMLEQISREGKFVHIR